MAPISAQAEDKPIDSNWYKSAFSALWASHIERNPDIQFIEQKVIQDKNAKALYRTWVMNACTTPGQEHYSYIKPGYGFPADVASTYYGPPKLEGKPILEIAEAVTLYQMVKNRNDHLFSNYREYVYSDSNENRAKAKAYLIEMCGEEAVRRLDSKIAERKAETTEESEANR